MERQKTTHASSSSDKALISSFTTPARSLLNNIDPLCNTNATVLLNRNRSRHKGNIVRINSIKLNIYTCLKAIFPLLTRCMLRMSYQGKAICELLHTHTRDLCSFCSTVLISSNIVRYLTSSFTALYHVTVLICI